MSMTVHASAAYSKRITSCQRLFSDIAGCGDVLIGIRIRYCMHMHLQINCAEKDLVLVHQPLKIADQRKILENCGGFR